MNDTARSMVRDINSAAYAYNLYSIQHNIQGIIHPFRNVTPQTGRESTSTRYPHRLVHLEKYGWIDMDMESKCDRLLFILFSPTFLFLY